MTNLRLRIKSGKNEIEVEGPEEVVDRQIAAFRRLIFPSEEPAKSAAQQSSVLKTSFHKLFRVRGPIYSLYAPATTADAAFLILLAQRWFRQNENVSGIEIMEGLRDSGIRVTRADALLMRYARRGLIVANGQHRARRYHLSADGILKAEKIAERLIGQLPPPPIPPQEEKIGNQN